MSNLLRAESQVAEQLDIICEKLVPLYEGKTATNQTGVSLEKLKTYDMVLGLAQGLITGTPVLFEGPTGIGKTALIKAFAESQSLNLTYLNGRSLSSAIFAVLDKNEVGQQQAQALEWLLGNEFNSSNPYILHIENLAKCNRRVYPVLIELLTRGTMFGYNLKEFGLVAAYATIDSGAYPQLDLTFDQASRCNYLDLDYNSTPWRELLNIKYKDTNLTEFWKQWEAQTPDVKEKVGPTQLINILEQALKPAYCTNALQVTGRDTIIGKQKI